MHRLLLLALALLLACAPAPRSPDLPRYEPGAGAPDLDAGIAFYTDRVQKNPDGFLDRAALAGLYLQKARHEPAYFLLAEKEAALSLQSLPNPEAKLVLAAVAEARHDFERALALTDQVLAQEPANADAMAQKITILLALGDLQGAARLADPLLAAAPGSAARNMRAQVLLARGDTAGAEAELRAALADEQPGEARTAARTRALLGRALALQGQDSAPAAFQAALEVDPEEPLALSGLAALREDTDPAAAEALYRRLESRTEAAGIDLARVLAKTGRAAQAEAQLERTEAALRRTLQDGGTGHKRDLARLLLVRGEVPDALDLLEEELAVRRDAGTLRLLAEARRRADRPAEALKALLEALERGYRSPGLLRETAALEEALGQADAAAAHRREAGEGRDLLELDH